MRCAAGCLNALSFYLRIPVPATAGYISLCDAAVVFVSYAFGPFTGLIAGGLGSAFADLLGGYPQFALLSFIVHGLEALLAGLLVKKNSQSIPTMIVGAIISIIIVCGGYLLLETLFITTFSSALVEVPMNALQSGVGAVVGLLLYTAVRKAYRNLDAIRW